MFKQMEFYEKKVELNATKSEYVKKRIGFVEKFEELKERKLALESQKGTQAKMFRTFVPFIQLCQRKVKANKRKSIMARWLKRKSIMARWLSMKLTEEIELLKKKTVLLETKYIKLQHSIEKHKIFKDFMEKIVREIPAITHKHELINRHRGLVQCNERLNTIQDEASDTLTGLKSRRKQFSFEALHLNLYNQLIHLNNEYSVQNRKIKKFQQHLDGLINTGTQKILALANIRLVTNELYRMIKSKDTTLDTFVQLSKIAIYGEQLQSSIRCVVELCKNDKKYRRISLFH
ncbi:Hypothetical predicted protein [Octopus vulgaris]|uniref:DUF4200 domain-containing protein n=1 Tax=Octopus vulgaris TaxID=6645 RepID=A0AA36F060_OCTVU|nr:Hypothetical predicted protein [Octopus vulgaris]